MSCPPTNYLRSRSTSGKLEKKLNHVPRTLLSVPFTRNESRTFFADFAFVISHSSLSLSLSRDLYSNLDEREAALVKCVFGLVPGGEGGGAGAAFVCEWVCDQLAIARAIGYLSSLFPLLLIISLHSSSLLQNRSSAKLNSVLYSVFLSFCFFLFSDQCLSFVFSLVFFFFFFSFRTMLAASGCGSSSTLFLQVPITFCVLYFLYSLILFLLSLMSLLVLFSPPFFFFSFPTMLPVSSSSSSSSSFLQVLRTFVCVLFLVFDSFSTFPLLLHLFPFKLGQAFQPTRLYHHKTLDVYVCVYTELPFCSHKTKKKLLQVVELRGFLSPIMCGDFRAVRWVGAKTVSGKKIGFNAQFLIFPFQSNTH